MWQPDWCASHWPHVRQGSTTTLLQSHAAHTAKPTALPPQRTDFVVRPQPRADRAVGTRQPVPRAPPPPLLLLLLDGWPQRECRCAAAPAVAALRARGKRSARNMVRRVLHVAYM